MDPATLALLAGVGGQAGAGILGEILSMKDKEAQRQMLQRLMSEFEGIDVPDLQPMAAEQLGDTALAGLETDADIRQSRDMELEALDALQSRYSSGRMSLEDRALQNEALNRSAAAESAGRHRIDEDMAMRGASNSGASLLMKLKNQQDAANRAASVGSDTAGRAQKQAFDAILARGRLASDVRGEDTALKGDVAGARDAISRYNAAGRERAKAYNAGLPQQRFDNRIRRAGGISNAGNRVANQYGQDADDTRQLYAGVGAAAAEGGQTAYRAKKKGGAY